MSRLAAACYWTLGRTLLLCICGWPVIFAIERWLRGLADSKRPLALCVILAPFVMPELLIGYAMKNVALASPARAEWICAGFLFLRTVPIGVIALLATPESLVEAAAIHCRRLLLRANRLSWKEWSRLALCYWHGPIRRIAPAMGLMGLVAFQEFELAALLQAPSWTDWFIVEQRSGLNQKEMLANATWPMLMQAPLLAGAIYLAMKGRSGRQQMNDKQLNECPKWIRCAVVTYLGFALAIGCLVPLGFISWSAPRGLSVLLRQPAQLSGLLHEILVAGAVSVCAGLMTWYLASVWLRSTRHFGLLMASKPLFLIPGLAGSLLPTLALVWVFQQPWLRLLYDSPIPWLCALIVWLAPRAVLLQLWLDAVLQKESIYLGELLLNTQIASGANRVSLLQLVFRLRDQPRLLAIGLLCYWAYIDLPTAYLLAPSGTPSGLVRLYGAMHFGHYPALSSQSLVFFGTPLVALFSVLSIVKAWKRWSPHRPL